MNRRSLFKSLIGALAVSALDVFGQAPETREPDAYSLFSCHGIHARLLSASPWFTLIGEGRWPENMGSVVHHDFSPP